jgi:hypothetical protein
MDMPQYILDNTDDEFSHANFLLGYLKSKGANTADLDGTDGLFGPHFRTLPGSVATGSTKKLRLTNITQLTIDTSFWGIYRTDNKNPDLNPNFKFAQAVPCPFLSQKLPICSIVRPTGTQGAAMAAAKTLTANGLFIGQTQEFFTLLADLATDADQARREGEHYADFL